MAAPIRVCFFGDSFVNGTGDDACLGWVGRACAAGRRNGADLTCYNLGIRGDSSADVLRRWEHEARARLAPEHDGRLVFSFGANDCCHRDDARQALANARVILASALAWRPTLMVGPLPICDRETDGRIATMSAALAPLCASLGVPYLDVFHHAANSSAWVSEVAAGDGAHPNSTGYTVVSDAFRCWAPWQAWIGLAARGFAPGPQQRPSLCNPKLKVPGSKGYAFGGVQRRSLWPGPIDVPKARRYYRPVSAAQQWSMT